MLWKVECTRSPCDNMKKSSTTDTEEGNVNYGNTERLRYGISSSLRDVHVVFNSV